MGKSKRKPNENLKNYVMNFCRRIAKQRPITSICICGDHAFGFPNERTPLEILAVIDGFKPRLMNYIKFFGDIAIIIYAVDKWVFERDAEQGFLGEALAVRLVFPYLPLLNAEYLKAEELKLKKRLILEILESLVLDFPELSYEIHIKPEYFMYEALLSRARLFPLTYHALSNFLHENVREENVRSEMEGYTYALKVLERENVVERVNGYIKVSKSFADAVKSKKIRFSSLLLTAQKTLFMTILGTFPKVFTALSQNIDFLLKIQNLEREESKSIQNIEDSRRYLLVPTANGFVPLANNINIEEFARTTLSANADAKVLVEPIGGFLNDVYLVRVFVGGKERKAVVKSFKDWSSFKWFPLTLWTFGTRTFALLGRSRLERECATNQLLYKKGVSVPRIFAINHDERLVFMEYIEGESLERMVKRIVNAKSNVEIEEDLKNLQKVGETFARVHALNVALGDTKPENIFIGKDGKIYLLDFEQSSKGGDKAWDIAEFLYYAGHYIPPLKSSHPVELIAKAFLKGYLNAGGNNKTVKDAGKTKYTKVFSVFVLPNTIFTISNICNKAEQLGLTDG